jgi:hypothetical protein
MTDWASQAYKNIMDSGEDWAEKEAAASLLEDTKKTILAQIKVNIGNECKSEAARETIALANKAYIDHVNEMNKAREAANKARVKWEASKTLASLRQTQESLKKAEMNLR